MYQSSNVEVVQVAAISIDEAVNSQNADHQWYQSIATELRSLIKNTLIHKDRPRDREVFDGSRILLQNKYNQDDILERRKARIVEKCYNEKPGVDFIRTFSPVLILNSIRTQLLLQLLYMECL